jgi:Tol biopolymer transport system component
MDIDGANAKQLTSGSGENFAQVSTDGKWVVYTLMAGKMTIWRVSIEGGAPVPVSEKSTSSPVVSPDGKWIAAIYWDEQPNSPARIGVMPFPSGDTLKVFEAPKSTWGNIRWMADGQALAYVMTSEGVSNIWTQAIAGGAPKQLTNFKSDQIFQFDWSRDGSQLVCARGSEIDDVVLISNFSVAGS